MSIYVAPRPADPFDALKAGPTGPGAGVLNTEFLLPMMLPTDHAQRMGQAVKLGTEVAYIRAAERVISGKFSTVPWHLEDPDGETIDEEYADARAVEAFTLLSDPMGALDVKEVGTKLTRRQTWEITSRHMGLAGCGAWYLDRLNEFGIPTAILYVRPDRLTPQYADGKSRLTGWLLDRRPGFEGTPLTIDQIRLLVLETPNEGVFPPGLVESALTKALLNGQIDKHFAQVLQAGGRLAGILAPKQGAIEDDGVYNQLIRDWRNITEQPESARRLQVTRAPVDFIRTAATMAEMQVIDLMTKNRDDLLALWGVPLSQVGGSTAAGLNSGDVRKYDEAALWQNAVHQRLEELAEGIQPLLQRWEPYMGWAPRFVIDEPEFDDDSPRYDKVQKAQFISLTNNERRDLIGQEPLPEDLIGPTGKPLGDEVWMGINMMPVGAPPMAPPTYQAQSVTTPGWSEEAGNIQKVPGSQNEGAAPITGSPPAVKAKGPDVTEAVLGQLRKQWTPDDLALVDKGKWEYDGAFPLKKVNAERRPIARNPSIVAGKEAALNIGAPIPPVILVHTKVMGKPGYEPIDGWHGVKAAQNAGLKRIPAYVGEGDADWTAAIVKIDDSIPTPPTGPGQKAAPVRLAGYQRSMRSLKDNLTARMQPQLRGAVSLVLDQQKRDIVSRVRTNYDAVKRNPRDTSIWWPPNAKWDDAMTAALRPSLISAAEQVNQHVSETVFAGKAAPIVATLTEVAAEQVAAHVALYAQGAVRTVLTRGAARVTGINTTTKTMIQKLVAQGIENGMSPAELGDVIEAASGFDEYRAEMIARTELGSAYNEAALGSYAENGVEMVQVLDGDGDDICAPWADVTVPIDEAPEPLGHPNCTRDILPVIGDFSEGKASIARPSMKADKAVEFLQALADDEKASRQEMVGVVTALTEAMKAQAAQPITISYRPPDIHVAPAVVTVEAPIVNVAAPEQRLIETDVTRDGDGNIIRTAQKFKETTG